MIYLDSDTVFVVENLRDSVTGSPINAATIEGRLKETDGTAIDEFAFEYIGGTEGNYRGTLTADQVSGLSECSEYLVDVVITLGGQTETRRQKHNCGFRGYE